MVGCARFHLAAEISAGTFLGTPGEGYGLRNFTYGQLAIGTIIARIVVAYVFIKPYYDYRVVSIYEYLQLRFGIGTRNAAPHGFPHHARARQRLAHVRRRDHFAARF